MGTETSTPCFLQPKFLTKTLPASSALNVLGVLGVLVLVSAVSVGRMGWIFQWARGWEVGSFSYYQIEKDFSIQRRKERQF